MLSGILLLNLDKEDEEIGSFYTKKALRIVVPYVLWNAIYYLIWRSRSQTGIIG
jgi:fucose 4-O-acetylase-like acetyltransferase